MTDADFVRAVLERPSDDLPRLIYADWLDERGDLRGEFIRVQIELSQVPPPGPVKPLRWFRWFRKVGGQKCTWCSRMAEDGECRWCTLRADEHRLMQQKVSESDTVRNMDRWTPEPIQTHLHLGTCKFHRGFVTHVSCTVTAWLAYGAAMLRLAPLETVTISPRAKLKFEWMDSKGVGRHKRPWVFWHSGNENATQFRECLRYESREKMIRGVANWSETRIY
jgi:uncharacterized protein (TIGR02996 family)